MTMTAPSTDDDLKLLGRSIPAPKQSVFITAWSALKSAFIVALPATVLVYASNSAFVMNFTSGWMSLRIHASLALCDFILALAMAICVFWIDRPLDSARLALSIWQRVLIAAMAITAANGLSLVLLALPIYDALVGSGRLHPLSLWIQTSLIGINLYGCLILFRAMRFWNERGLGVQAENDELTIALERAEIAILDAQIEPHFLFNTLAHISHEYRFDFTTGETLLTALIAYLDGAVPALRRADWTVGDEFALIDTYLSILSQRFGDRLQYAVQASDASRSALLPALTIATLVENAVRHGLAPKADVGTVSISARVEANQLHIDVVDNGVGLKATSGTGLGLVTVRARLHTMHGKLAQVSVVPGSNGGVHASASIPLRR
jgi:hypothetical protein